MKVGRRGFQSNPNEKPHCLLPIDMSYEYSFSVFDQDFINNLGMITMLLVIVLGDDDSDEDDNDYNALGRALSATNRDLEKK